MPACSARDGLMAYMIGAEPHLRHCRLDAAGRASVRVARVRATIGDDQRRDALMQGHPTCACAGISQAPSSRIPWRLDAAKATASSTRIVQRCGTRTIRESGRPAGGRQRRASRRPPLRGVRDRRQRMPAAATPTQRIDSRSSGAHMPSGTDDRCLGSPRAGRQQRFPQRMPTERPSHGVEWPREADPSANVGDAIG